MKPQKSDHRHFACRNHNPFYSSCMTCHWITNKSNMSHQWISNCISFCSTQVHQYFSEVPVTQPSIFCVVFCKPMFVLFFFFWAIILSVLRFTLITQMVSPKFFLTLRLSCTLDKHFHNSSLISCTVKYDYEETWWIY